MTVRAVLADGRLRVDPLQIGIDGKQSFAITGTVDASGAHAAAWSFLVTARSINVGEMLNRFGTQSRIMTGGVSDITLEGTGRGNSVRAILGSLTGSARMQGGLLVVRSSSVNRSPGLLLGLMDIVNPFRNTDQETRVKCVGINVPIKDGVLTWDRAAAAETTKFNVVASGTINLRTEVIDLWVAPILAQGFSPSTGSPTQLVRVDGTLADPQLNTNIAGAATRGALSLGTAYMTGRGSSNR